MRVPLAQSVSARRTGGKRSLLLMVSTTVVFSLFIAFSTKPVADFLYLNVARLDDPALNALEFAVYPLVLALVVVMWRPAFYGVQIGRTFREWRLVLVSLAVVGLVVGAYVLAGNQTPWDGRGVVNFTVVPLYEELLYRGVLLSVLLAYGRRYYSEAGAVRLAIVLSALGFGLSHASNGFYVGWAFALFQVAYASLFGLLAGYNRVTTESVVAPILLHALMNALPIVL